MPAVAPVLRSPVVSGVGVGAPAAPVVLDDVDAVLLVWNTDCVELAPEPVYRVATVTPTLPLLVVGPTGLGLDIEGLVVIELTEISTGMVIVWLTVVLEAVI